LNTAPAASLHFICHETEFNMRHSIPVTVFFMFGILASLSACCYQMPPQLVGPKDVEEVLARRAATTTQPAPVAHIPARIAVARVTYRGNLFSIRHQSDKEPRLSFGAQFSRTQGAADAGARLAKLPQVAGVAPLNHLLLPDEFDDDYALRLAASRIKADLLLIYSLYSERTTDGVEFAPVTIATLGLAPDKTITVGVTATCALIDVRTGHVLGRARAKRESTELSTDWHHLDATSAALDHAEDESLERLMDQFELCWRDVLQQWK